MGKHKVGRNEPCPCGSGKKYKNCCYPDKTRLWKTAGPYESPAFVVKPKETPEPIAHHLVSSDAGKTWEQQPGLLTMRLYDRDPTDIDEAVNQMMQLVLEVMSEMGLNDDEKQDFARRIRDVDHKLHAVKYHLNNYTRTERQRISDYNGGHVPPVGVQTVTEVPKLLYEVEAFLFQTKSCLDVLSWVLKPAFGFNYCSFGDKGDGIVQQLKNNCPAPLGSCAGKIMMLIEKAQEAWLVELIQMRDQVTHYSRLQGFECFVEDPYVGDSVANIHYPTMPNGERAFDYCQKVWVFLLSFCSDFLKLALEATTIRRQVTP